MVINLLAEISNILPFWAFPPAFVVNKMSAFAAPKHSPAAREPPAAASPSEILRRVWITQGFVRTYA